MRLLSVYESRRGLHVWELSLHNFDPLRQQKPQLT